METAFEIFVRISVFVGLFVVIGTLEWRFPRRARQHNHYHRWWGNVSISFINQGLTRVFIPLSAVSLAITCGQQGWGLLNQVTLPGWAKFIIALICLDLVIYWQHRIYHQVPLLWRFHRIHHADTAFDLSTGIRFHPGSILLSALIKLGAVAALGPAAVAVLVFEVLLNATSLFNHSNLRLPNGLDRLLRRIMVTPDMHRVHHSVQPEEMQRNFGFNFPWWDWLFRSYLAQPESGHEAMTLGLPQFREETALSQLLLQPFRKS